MVDKPKQQKPTIDKQEVVAKSRLFAVEQLNLTFSNGVERVYERLITPPIPAVMVVALLDEEHFIMIQEYAAGFHEYQLTLPKGALDRGETVEEAANRELMEEAGYGARQLTEIKELSLAPGYMGHRLTVVMAEDLYEKRLPGDEPEPIEVIRCAWSELDTIIKDAHFTEGRAVAALYMVRDLLLSSGRLNPEVLFAR